MGRSEARARSNSIRYRGMNQITKPKPGDVPAKGTTRGTAYQPPYATAGIVTLAVFALYAITLSRTTWFWDTSEYIATAHIMGIPHPPGDRKSTRLNSSHVAISYATSCLKKKSGLKSRYPSCTRQTTQ